MWHEDKYCWNAEGFALLSNPNFFLQQRWVLTHSVKETAIENNQNP